ncbi:hypothetical protein [Pseudarthrobacter sp. PS3-L1]|uniref:hypothetical protein n=1 Tax=Pseudarthrobacter sp. PS3-L1 TaxID=3046207 RepID=UPI0024B8EAC9|nr:hypothetical protein [Pseudarthrobacter sp. PS3-L1]MDJ0319968.1 hypothetical protein [Pseudarthrobacter sp. PS3-L1]
MLEQTGIQNVLTGGFVMAHRHIRIFLSEAVSADPGSEEGLNREQLFGLYTSWCVLNDHEPLGAHTLWMELRAHHVDPDKNSLAMTGEAATDYIVSSAPDLV